MFQKSDAYDVGKFTERNYVINNGLLKETLF